MNSSEIQKIFQTIVKRIRCPHCGRQYSFENIHILNSTKSVCFLQLKCGNHSPTLASVVINGPKMAADKQERKVSSDDLLDAHYKISRMNKIEELFSK